MGVTIKNNIRDPQDDENVPYLGCNGINVLVVILY